MSPEQGHERWEALMMRAVDGWLDDPADRRALNAHLLVCAECRAELDDFVTVKRTTDAMTARILADVRIEPLRPGPGARVALGTSFFLLACGAALLLGFAGWTFLSDAGVPAVVKLGATVAGLGGVGLLGYVLWVRARAAGRDPYEEIDL